jgi:fatty acid synthase subunit alpha
LDAFSVGWVEAQDMFFEKYKFERFIEVGPFPTLTSMAIRALEAKYET